MNSTWTIIISGLVSIAVTLITFFITNRYVSKKEEREKSREEKMVIFKTLMSTRGTNFNYRIVEAINAIDVIFCEHKDVLDAKNKYLNEFKIPDDASESKRTEIMNVAKDNFITLMEKMAKVLKLDDNISWQQIKKNYIPKWVADSELSILAQNEYWIYQGEMIRKARKESNQNVESKS